MKFVEDTPIKRGRTFSALIGLGQISEIRQVLEVLANRGTLIRDLGMTELTTRQSSLVSQSARFLTQLKASFTNVTGQEFPDEFNVSTIVDRTTKTLRGIALLQPFLTDIDIINMDFEEVRNVIRDTENSEDQERLSHLSKTIQALEGLAPNVEESSDIDTFSEVICHRIESLQQTRGPKFKLLYETVTDILSSEDWDNPNQCPACETELSSPLAPQVSTRLDEYSKVQKESEQIILLWSDNNWVNRIHSMIEAPELSQTEEVKNNFRDLDIRMREGQPITNDFETLLALIQELDTQRTATIEALKSEKSALEKELPASLVILTEQLVHAEQIKATLEQMQEIKDELIPLATKIERRTKWCGFIQNASTTFAAAEVTLSTARTTQLETQYQSMYATITNNPNIVPRLKKSSGTEELYLSLDKFYTLENLAASTLLAESYRNALAISLYFSSLLEHASTARFVVLDDVTSSFDAGHQYAIMELVRTSIARPKNADGPQFIILSHDGLLEKYFDKLSGTPAWHHQRLHGLPPRGSVFTQAQDANRLHRCAEDLLNNGQVPQAEPLIRQYLEFKLLEIIRKVNISVPLDFAIRDDKQMVQNCINSIMRSVRLHQSAGILILEPRQVTGLNTIHVPSIIANWISHYSTGVTSSLSPYVLLGVLDTIDNLSECFMYDCQCSGTSRKRFYRNLSRKHCGC